MMAMSMSMGKTAMEVLVTVMTVMTMVVMTVMMVITEWRGW